MSVAQVIASILAQLAKGTPIWKVSVPAEIHTDVSEVQNLANQMHTNEEKFILLNNIDYMDDPLERIASIISFVADPYRNYITDKPFNPVLGEFVKEITTIASGTYIFEVEQISHSPPINSERLTGPNFIYETPNGIQGSKNFKISFNRIDVAMNHVITTLRTKSGKSLEFSLPGFKVDNLFFGTRSTGQNGNFWVRDNTSGYEFEGRITKPFQITGDLYDDEEDLVGSIKGDMRKGVYMVGTGALWIEPLKFKNLSGKVVPQEVLDDPLYSENVWKEVYKYMRCDPVDFDNANREKGIVENKQRVIAKNRKTSFNSRFGFTYELSSS
jgi:hypothetical protein